MVLTNDADTSGYDSADEALCELLGIQSLSALADDEVEQESKGHRTRTVDDLVGNMTDEFIAKVVKAHNLQDRYVERSTCILPEDLAVPSPIMRILTEQVVWGKHKDDPRIERTYETIQVLTREGHVDHRRTLTRLENLNGHTGWNDLCNIYIRRIVSTILGSDYVLFKTKLNLKPPGGSGFAPHVDTPSLMVPFGDDGPQSFVTVMIAIDDMTVDNGCLRVASSALSSTSSYVLRPIGENPDSDGRAGAIAPEACFQYDDITCKGGTVVLFGGWVPHRSSANKSRFPRRAVFLTYAPAKYGDFHDRYYDRMKELRRPFQSVPAEISALDTIPRI